MEGGKVMDNIHRGSIRKPVENQGGDAREAIIHCGGARIPKSDFCRRPDVGPGPVYLGPSKLQGRSTAIKGGTGQSKKHKSTGKGQR